MNKIINTQDALDAIDANVGILYDSPTLVTSLKKMVNKLPPVDAVPVRQGHWERGLDKDGDWISVCSVCGEVALYDKADDAYLHTVFCPWCGARMDGDDND